MKIIILSFILALLPLLTSAQQKEQGVLKAGFTKIDITPSDSVMLYGYAARKKPSVGVHDPLSARISVFDSKGKKLLFISSDLGSYPSDIYAGFKDQLMKKYNLKEIRDIPIHNT